MRVYLDYLKKMNYILKYGENDNNDNDETFNRWGGESVDYTRKYAPGFSGNVSSIVKRLFHIYL